MSKLEILAVTARTVSLLAAPDGAKFTLASPLAWRLLQNGEPIQLGDSNTAGLFIDQLVPDTTYEFVCPFGTISFSTLPCGGLVNSAAFGANPENDDNQEAFAAAIAALPDNGTLYVPAGTYQTRPIFLKSNMTLLLDKDAALSAVADRKDWPQLEPKNAQGQLLGSWEGLPSRCYAAIITAINCDSLNITGRGTIDGGGSHGDWWDWPKEQRDNAWRARTIHLINSNNVSLSGIKVQNSPSWTIHPHGCKNLSASNLSIFNPANSPNTDGLNPESCENVRITATQFDVGDDCIAIKAGKRENKGENTHLAPTTNVSIRHCLMQHGHGAVVLGSEMSGSISRVSVTDCQFDGTDRGIRIKTRRGRGGTISDLTAHNIEMTRVPAPFTVNAHYFCDEDGKSDWVQSRTPAPVDTTTPKIANIHLSRISATGVAQVAIAALGLPEAPITNITIDQFDVQFADNTHPEVPLMALHVPAMHKQEIFSEYAHIKGAVRVRDKEQGNE